jgi:hypothetical protein
MQFNQPKQYKLLIFLLWPMFRITSWFFSHFPIMSETFCAWWIHKCSTSFMSQAITGIVLIDSPVVSFWPVKSFSSLLPRLFDMTPTVFKCTIVFWHNVFHIYLVCFISQSGFSHYSQESQVSDSSIQELGKIIVPNLVTEVPSLTEGTRKYF